MKRFYSIFFLILFLLYHVGYIGVYWLAANQIDDYWNSPSNFKGQVKKISIPMALPYWGDHEDYRPTDGTFEWEGKTYRKVLRKYAQDTVHLILIEDKLTAQLDKSIKEWIQLSTESTSDENSKTTFLKTFAKDYVQVGDLVGISASIREQNPGNTKYVATDGISALDITSPPPKG